MLAERGERVGRAAGREAASPGKQRPQRPPVQVNGQTQEPGKQFHCITPRSLCATAAKLWESCSKSTFAASGRAMNTTSTPAGMSFLFLRNSCRNLRRTLFLMTAFPTLLETVKPARVTARPLGSASARSIPAEAFRPPCWMRRKSALRNRRSLFGNFSPLTSWARKPPGAPALWPCAASRPRAQPCWNCASESRGFGFSSPSMVDMSAWLCPRKTPL